MSRSNVPYNMYNEQQNLLLTDLSPDPYVLGSFPFIEMLLKQSSDRNYRDLILMKQAKEAAQKELDANKENKEKIGKKETNTTIIAAEEKEDAQKINNEAEILENQRALEGNYIVCRFKYIQKNNVAYGVNRLFSQDVKIVPQENVESEDAGGLQFGPHGVRSVPSQGNATSNKSSHMKKFNTNGNNSRWNNERSYLKNFGTALPNDIVVVKLLPQKDWDLPTIYSRNIVNADITEMLKTAQVSETDLYGKEACEGASTKETELTLYTQGKGVLEDGRKILNIFPKDEKMNGEEKDVVEKRQNESHTTSEHNDMIYNGNICNLSNKNKTTTENEQGKNFEKKSETLYYNAESIHHALGLKRKGFESQHNADEIFTQLIALNRAVELEKTGKNNLLKTVTPTDDFSGGEERNEKFCWESKLNEFPTWPHDKKPKGFVVFVLQRACTRRFVANLPKYLEYRHDKNNNSYLLLQPALQNIPKVVVLEESLRKFSRQFDKEVFILEIPFYTQQEIAKLQPADEQNPFTKKACKCRNLEMKQENEEGKNQNKYQGKTDDEPRIYIKSIDHGKYVVACIVAALGNSDLVTVESRKIATINNIIDSEFSQSALDCIPTSFVITQEEFNACQQTEEHFQSEESNLYRQMIESKGNMSVSLSMIKYSSALKPIRRDLTSEFVCTIDPSTAKDLDDAISVSRCKLTGNYIVGVHIADVTNFVIPYTALDEEAQMRQTSVYMVERAIPMLPPVLSEDYCSLNAGTFKYAFSSMFELDKNTFEVISESFGRSIIRNRCRLTYADAQRIIEGDQSGEGLVFSPFEMILTMKEMRGYKPISMTNFHSNFDKDPMTKNEEKQARSILVKRTCQAVKRFFEVSKSLKKNAEDRGRINISRRALHLNFAISPWKVLNSINKKNVDISEELKKIKLDPVYKYMTDPIQKQNYLLTPISCSAEHILEANWTIEYLMLLNNTRAAMKILQMLPKTAYLRSHAFPTEIRATILSARLNGYELQAGNSKLLNSSLAKYADNTNYDALCNMLVLCMKRATCVCASIVEEEELAKMDDIKAKLEELEKRRDRHKPTIRDGLINRYKKEEELAFSYRKIDQCKTLPFWMVKEVVSIETIKPNVEKNTGDEGDNIQEEIVNSDKIISAHLGTPLVDNDIEENEEKNELPLQHTKNVMRDTLYHYGLATPYYTFFTSPIRRYADVMAHRQMLLAVEVERIYQLVRNLTIMKRKLQEGVPPSHLRTLPGSRENLPAHFWRCTLAEEDKLFWSSNDDELFAKNVCISMLPQEVHKYHYSTEEVTRLANEFNQKNINAHKCGQDSEEFFFGLYVSMLQKKEEISWEQEWKRFIHEANNDQFMSLEMYSSKVGTKEKKKFDRQHTRGEDAAGLEVKRESVNDNDSHTHTQLAKIDDTITKALSGEKLNCARSDIFKRFPLLSRSYKPILLHNPAVVSRIYSLMQLRAPLFHQRIRLTVVSVHKDKFVCVASDFNIIKRFSHDYFRKPRNCNIKVNHIEHSTIKEEGEQYLRHQDANKVPGAIVVDPFDGAMRDGLPLQRWVCSNKFIESEYTAYIDWGQLPKNMSGKAIPAELSSLDSVFYGKDKILELNNSMAEKTIKQMLTLNKKKAKQEKISLLEQQKQVEKVIHKKLSILPDNLLQLSKSYSLNEGMVERIERNYVLASSSFCIDDIVEVIHVMSNLTAVVLTNPLRFIIDPPWERQGGGLLVNENSCTDGLDPYKRQ